jgi:hypothetical protein
MLTPDPRQPRQPHHVRFDRLLRLSIDVLEDDEPPGGSFTLMLPATIKDFGFHNNKWSEYT